MIKEALKFIRESLNQNLKLRFGLNENVVVISRLIDQDSSVPLMNQNKIVLSLLNLEQETARQFTDRYTRLNNNVIQDVSPSQRFNLDIMFSASFDDYEESLGFLDATVAFFQANPSINSQTSSNLPEGIEKLNLDIEKLDYNQTYNLWSSIGAKYVPSVVYKVRLITIQSEEVVQLDPAIHSMDSQATPSL